MTRRRKRKRKKNPGGFWAWATKHWIISGFILLPTALMVPVYIVQALRPKPERERLAPGQVGVFRDENGQLIRDFGEV